MSFADFSYADITGKLGLRVEHRQLFEGTPKIPASAWLVETLSYMAPVALSVGNEKARSEMLITPILIEVQRARNPEVSLFSGVAFTADAARDLTGVCDFVLSRSPERIMLTAPIVAIVEAKKEDIVGGLGQCAAEMLAARIFNERGGHPIEVAWGTVTTGSEWRFLRLGNDGLAIDTDLYFLSDVAQILGIFRAMLGETP